MLQKINFNTIGKCNSLSGFLPCLMTCLFKLKLSPTCIQYRTLLFLSGVVVTGFILIISNVVN